MTLCLLRNFLIQFLLGFLFMPLSSALVNGIAVRKRHISMHMFDANEIKV